MSKVLQNGGKIHPLLSLGSHHGYLFQWKSYWNWLRWANQEYGFHPWSSIFLMPVIQKTKSGTFSTEKNFSSNFSLSFIITIDSFGIFISLLLAICNFIVIDSLWYFHTHTANMVLLTTIYLPTSFKDSSVGFSRATDGGAQYGFFTGTQLLCQFLYYGRTYFYSLSYGISYPKMALVWSAIVIPHMFFHV